MPKPLELAGREFGKLTVISRSHKDNYEAWVWSCVCRCGTRALVRGSTLVAGRTSACIRCAAAIRQRTHGQSQTALYSRWRSMLERCTNARNAEYRNYGGRGISVSGRWRRFEAFAADMGPTFAANLELDRIDVNGNYEPGNCRWANRIEQQRNRRNNHVVEWRGRSLVVQGWAEILGIKPNTIVHRLRRGWSVDRALTKGASPAALIEIANGVTA